MSVSSLKERGRVKGGFAGAGGFRACVTGVSCFPGSCHVRGGRPGEVKDRAEPGRRGGAGGVLEVTGREPDDLAAGTGAGSRGRAGRIRLFRSVPWWGPGAGSAAGCSHPFACPRPGPGRMGRVRVRRGGQAGSIKGAPALPGEGGGADTGGDLAPGRWPGRAVHAARAGGWVTGGPAGAGQAADLPVAQAVEHQGEEPAGGGDLGDVAGFLPAAGDDAGFDRAG